MSLPTTSLLRSLQIQKRVIGALLMREIITRFGRHDIGFLWLFVEPMLFTLGITALWTLSGATHGSSLPITAFALTGYSTMLLWRNCSNRVMKAIEVNQSLLYHRNVCVIDVFAARILLEVLGATISIIILTIIFTFVGLISPPADILTIIMGWLLMAWFAFSLSLIVGAISERSELLERVWHIITYLMFPLSGAVFMVDWLPTKIQSLALWIPMVHGSEMIRHGYFGSSVRTYENPIYLATVNLVMMLIGLSLVRETGRRVEPE